MLITKRLSGRRDIIKTAHPNIRLKKNCSRVKPTLAMDEPTFNLPFMSTFVCQAKHLLRIASIQK